MRYVSSDSHNQSLGASIKSVFAAMGSRVEPILEKNNLANVESDKWYPQQDYLNVYNDLEADDSSVMSDLVSIGMKILDEAQFPPDIDNIEKALLSMDAYYKLNNRDAYGGWQVEIDEKSATCTSTTPFPTDLEYGILYAMARRFAGQGKHVAVKYQNTVIRNQRKGHDAPCVYLVTWE
ncbi:MAG: hypothetical protein AAF846_20095 [Chloroflexota bacterium]